MPSAVFIRARMFSDADLIGQLDHAVLTEAGAQVGYLLVGDGTGIGSHRVGIGDRGPFIIGEIFEVA